MNKRILFINGHLNTGGIERSLVDVLRHLDPKKYEIDLLLLQGEGEYRDEVPQYVHTYVYSTDRAFGSIVHSFFHNLKSLNLWAILFRIVWLVYSKFGPRYLYFLKFLFKPCQKTYDVAISYRTEMSNTILAYVVNAEKKINWWHHGSFQLEGLAKEALHKEYLRLNHIVTVSKNTNDLLCKHYPDLTPRIVTINNMVCVDDITQKANLYAVKKKENLFTIVSVGRLYQDKNARMCSKIAIELKHFGIPFVWYIVGEGDERIGIEQDIRENGLENSVILTGSLSNPYPYISSADILFHASPLESQGLTILESMALGTPVICVKSAGPSEFIYNGENGIMIKNDVPEAVTAILHMYEDSQMRKSIAEKASVTITSFNPISIIQKIEALL